MNARFSDNSVRIRLTREEALDLQKGKPVEFATRFPVGKRLRCGVRLARVASQSAVPLVVSFSTEAGGFGADLLFVVSDGQLQRLLESEDLKNDSIAADFENPDGSRLTAVLEIDAKSRR